MKTIHMRVLVVTGKNNIRVKLVQIKKSWPFPCGQGFSTGHRNLYIPLLSAPDL